MPYHLGLLPSRLQQASWFSCLASSRPNFLHPERPLDGAASFFHSQIFCYRSKICPDDEPGEQMGSTEEPRKLKIKKFGNINYICWLKKDLLSIS
jgi:hypothetical protein